MSIPAAFLTAQMSCKIRKFCRASEGYSLLELIFVVSVVAVILLLAINHYNQMKRHTTLVQVKSDTEIIQRGLNNYFHRIGCNQDGSFSLMPVGGKEYQPTIDDLTINTPSYSYYRRLPLVRAYRVFVIASDQKNSTNAKPIYFLRTMAQLNVPLSQITWYQLQLNASGVSGDSIYWQGMPTTSYVQPIKNLWVLDGSRILFRQAEEDIDSTSVPTSGSYCAN